MSRTYVRVSVVRNSSARPVTNSFSEDNIRKMYFADMIVVADRRRLSEKLSIWTSRTRYATIACTVRMPRERTIFRCCAVIYTIRGQRTIYALWRCRRCEMSPLIKTKQWEQTGVCMSVFDNEVYPFISFFFFLPRPPHGLLRLSKDNILGSASLQHVNDIINYGTKLLNSCNSNWY